MTAEFILDSEIEEILAKAAQLGIGVDDKELANLTLRELEAIVRWKM
jgi:hypothetical protein